MGIKGNVSKIPLETLPWTKGVREQYVPQIFSKANTFIHIVYINSNVQKPHAHKQTAHTTQVHLYLTIYAHTKLTCILMHSNAQSPNTNIMLTHIVHVHKGSI